MKQTSYSPAMDRQLRPSLTATEQRNRSLNIESMRKAGMSNAAIFHELDGRQHVFEAYQAAAQLLNEVGHAYKREGDVFDSQRMSFELVEMVVALLSTGKDPGPDERMMTIITRRSVLGGQVDGLMADGAFTLSEITDLLEYLYPVMDCGDVR